jgi:phage terminase large subunit-like protein
MVHLCGPCLRRNSQLYSTAQSRDQAAVLFNLAAKMVRLSPVLSASVTIRDTVKELLCTEMGTRYRALSAEAATNFGLSPSFIVHDELGQVRGPRSTLYEALETATGAQEEPLTVVISTQAPTDGDLLSILIDDALAGHDKRTVVKLFTAPMTADPFSERTIKKANPAYGEFLNAREVRAMAQDAKRMPAREAEYRNLVLNQRVETSNPFVTQTMWQTCGGEVADMRGMSVYGGLDLSSVSDLTALVLIGKVGRVWHVKPTFWLPEVGLREKSQKDRTPYDLWHRDGHLQTTLGSTVSYEFVAAYLRRVFNEHRVEKLGFDRWNMQHLIPWLLKVGFSQQEIDAKFVKFGQGTQSMSPALRAGKRTNGPRWAGRVD